MLLNLLLGILETWWLLPVRWSLRGRRNSLQSWHGVRLLVLSPSIGGEERFARILRCRPLIDICRGLWNRNRGLEASLRCAALVSIVLCIVVVLTVVSGTRLVGATVIRCAGHDQRCIGTHLRRRPLRSKVVHLQFLVKGLFDGLLMNLCLSLFNIFLNTSLMLLIQFQQDIDQILKSVLFVAHTKVLLDPLVNAFNIFSELTHLFSYFVLINILKNFQHLFEILIRIILILFWLLDDVLAVFYDYLHCF